MNYTPASNRFTRIGLFGGHRPAHAPAPAVPAVKPAAGRKASQRPRAK